MSSGRLTTHGLAASVGRRTVVHDVDLEVTPGQMTAVVGVNGGGKSTLLRALAGTTRPAGGRVLLDGQDLHAMRGRDRARRVALVEQDSQPAAELLVGEVVALGRTPHRPPWAGGSEDDAQVLEALACVGLDSYVDRPVARLSGGERRRVMLARGIAQDTCVLVLDEPTNHLDVRHQVELLQRLRRLDRTVVAAVHDLGLALRWFDRVAVLHDGTLHASGPPSEVLEPHLIRTVFGVTASRLQDPATGREHLVLDPS